MMNLGASGLLLLWFLSGCSGQGPHPSPCPDLFSYHYDSTSGWYGIVTILPPGTFAEARLVFKMTIANYNLNQGYGRIEVLGGNAEVQEISKSAYQGQRRKVQFMIIFPPITTIPRVKEVLINDVTFCADQRYYGAGANIELKYTITTGVESPPVSGNQFSIIHSRNQPAQPAVQRPVPAHNTWGQNSPSPLAVQIPVPAHNTWGQNSPSPPVQRPIQSQSIWNQDSAPPGYGNRYEAPVPTQGSYIDNSGSYENPLLNPATYKPVSGTTIRPQRPTTTTRTTTTSIEDYDFWDPDQTYQCGLHNGMEKTDKLNFLVIQGSVTEKGQWPWHVAIFKNEGSSLKYICGGTLVSREHIITAAHCVNDLRKKQQLPPNIFVIFLGKHDLGNWQEDSEKHVKIREIHTHPKYEQKSTINYDIAVIELSQPVEFNQFISPVCLWDKSSDVSQIVGKAGTVVGWGTDEFGAIANLRRAAKMPIVSQEECIRSDEFFAEFTSDVTFCAGYRNGTSVCNGDSGGGMTFKLKNQKLGGDTWYLRGVISTSKLDENSANSCDVHSYVVFTDIAQLLPWIHSKMGLD